MLSLQEHVEKRMCEDDHLFFTRRFFKPRMGFKFMVNWHHIYIAYLIDEVIKGHIDNLVINVPPGAGKTEMTTNLIPRGIARNPRSRFLYLSFSQSLVEEVASTARNIVKSEDFQKLWPVNISKSSDAKSNWKTTVDGYDAGHVYGASMGGQVTGRRAGTLADEGFTSKPVRPTQGDVPTIGHGTTVYPNGKAVTMHDKPISRQTADYYLKDHISKVEKQFKHSIPNVKLAQSEYDAYIDFVYQFGIGTFNQSSIRINLLQGNYVQACKALLKYKYTAGRDCSIRSNNCYGVYVRQNNRYEKCMEANQ